MMRFVSLVVFWLLGARILLVLLIGARSVGLCLIVSFGDVVLMVVLVTWLRLTCSVID